MKILSWGRTDVGQKRDHNEDAFLVTTSPTLVAVADGMGGHLGGARASKMAVEMLQQELSQVSLCAPSPTEGDPYPASVIAVREAARAAGRAIYDAAQADETLRGMGTTLTAIVFVEGWGILAHVGDSRAYLFRDGKLQQLSEDHSWVQEQHRAGWLTFDEVRTSKFRHVITRSVGYERDVKVDAVPFPVQMGDCFLLCTDGLSTFVNEAEIEAILASQFFEDVPDVLIALANSKGGDDNVSVVVAYAGNIG